MSDDRLNNLEARFAWLERHVGEQDRAMAGMGDEMRRIRRELETLRERVREPDGPAGPPDTAERPPHY
jgi:uncharacterized coiled-coil protein SlyX